MLFDGRNPVLLFSISWSIFIPYSAANFRLPCFKCSKSTGWTSIPFCGMLGDILEVERATEYSVRRMPCTIELLCCTVLFSGRYPIGHVEFVTTIDYYSSRLECTVLRELDHIPASFCCSPDFQWAQNRFMSVFQAPTSFMDDCFLFHSKLFLRYTSPLPDESEGRFISSPFHVLKVWMNITTTSVLLTLPFL